MRDKSDNKKKARVEISKGKIKEEMENPPETASRDKLLSETDAENREDFTEETDRVTEEPAVDEAGEGAEPEEKTVEQIRTEYEATINALEDRYLRLAAEFDNYKKRTARQFDEILKNSNENIIVQILEVADNFQRALEAASESSDFESLCTGNELIYQHLFDILKKEGVETIEAVGKEFDPGLHEAIMQVESEEYPEGVIVQEITRGYKLNGKVIRFAKVVVSKGKEDRKGASD